MSILLERQIPKNETELLTRCKALAGMSFAQLASLLSLNLPYHSLQRKGWLGQAVELVLGASAGQQALPDFISLGIELKTVPVSGECEPIESTYISRVQLKPVVPEYWHTSSCYQKLRRVLWLPVEGDRDIPYAERRIGMGFIWSPDSKDLAVLEEDWTMLTNLIQQGQIAKIDARIGTYLQIRPKAHDGSALCDALGEDGEIIKTLPRGFYLRRQFVSQILKLRSAC